MHKKSMLLILTTLYIQTWLFCHLYLSWPSRRCVYPPKSLVYQHSTELIQPRSFQQSKLLEHVRDQSPNHWNSENCLKLPKLVQIFEINCFLLHPFPSTSRCQECLLPRVGMDIGHGLRFNQWERRNGCKWPITGFKALSTLSMERFKMDNWPN